MDTDHDALSRARGEKIEMKARDKVLVCKGGDGVRLLHITRIKMAGDCHSDWPVSGGACGAQSPQLSSATFTPSKPVGVVTTVRSFACEALFTVLCAKLQRRTRCILDNISSRAR